ncbi:hypothetical protein ATANTOWER_025898, partial [Ataeniobius toweri]|nr:hypothetical protein [Ataeniobius toweri]
IQDQVSSVIKQNLFHQPSDCSIESSTNNFKKCVEPFTSTAIPSQKCPRKGGRLPVTGLSV